MASVPNDEACRVGCPFEFLRVARPCCDMRLCPLVLFSVFFFR
uniref:Uncharacterized protein n=1 Tax=Anguilla anguilla TaxID=7936 RepID=A0A0E9QMD4_ANGAN